MTMVKLIRTANQQIAVRQRGGYRAFVASQLDARWQGATPDWAMRGDPIQAQVVRSDWIVVCPDCKDAIAAEPGEPFYCLECQNAKNDGKARPVQFPEERAAIEKILLARFDPKTRNWSTETLEELRAENTSNGEAIE